MRNLLRRLLLFPFVLVASPLLAVVSWLIFGSSASGDTISLIRLMWYGDDR